MTLNLITDRTEADVLRAKQLNALRYSNMTTEEQVEWNAGLRGAYNWTDFNRVESAVRYLSDRLNESGFALDLETKTDWTREDIPTPEDLERYIRNVEKVRAAIPMLPTTPQTPEDMKGLWWYEANDIEKILADVNLLIEWMVYAFKRSNAYAFWSGNKPLPSSKSDMGRTWAELDAMDTTWRNWQVADWYLLLYGNLKAEGDVV